MRKNKRGIIFLITSFVFLLASNSFILTGSVIAKNFRTSFSYFSFIGIIFFFVSIIIFTSRQTLDAIIVPTGSHEDDIKRARKAGEKKDELKDKGYFVISGYVAKEENGDRKSVV